MLPPLPLRRGAAVLLPLLLLCLPPQTASDSATDTLEANDRTGLVEPLAPEIEPLSERRMDVMMLLWSAALVFLMQAGFGLLEAGVVRPRAASDTLLKNLFNSVIGTVIWYFFGFGFAYGSAGSFLGADSQNFAFHPEDWADSYKHQGLDWATWLTSLTFALATATIVSGGVAERCHNTGYCIYTTVVIGWIYPVMVHWFWSPEGWLSVINANEKSALGGATDIAGGCVVHITGGVAALVGAMALGPRKGRFVDGKDTFGIDTGASTTLQCLGTFFLWASWYGMAVGNGTILLKAGRNQAISRSCVCLTLGAASAGLSATLTRRYFNKRGEKGLWDVRSASNGVLAGLVTVSSGCATIDPWVALVMGAISGWVYDKISATLIAVQLDDPLDSFAVHGACGVWGMIGTGLFTTEAYTINQQGSYGFFYGSNVGMLGIQIVSTGVCICWVAFCSAAVFKILDYCMVLQLKEPATMAPVNDDL